MTAAVLCQSGGAPSFLAVSMLAGKCSREKAKNGNERVVSKGRSRAIKLSELIARLVEKKVHEERQEPKPLSEKLRIKPRFNAGGASPVSGLESSAIRRQKRKAI